METDLPDVLNDLPVSTILLLPNDTDVKIRWANQSFYSLTGTVKAGIIGKSVQWLFTNCILPDDEDGFELISGMIEDVTTLVQSRQTGILKCVLSRDDSKKSEKKYLQFKGSPVTDSNGRIKQVVLLIEDATNAIQLGKQFAEDPGKTDQPDLEERNENLEIVAAQNRARFESASKELDDFVYSVSHDLRAPLRRIDGFSQELIESYLEQLDETGQHYLRRIRQGAQDMGNLIDDLLKLSRISRRNVERKEFNFGELVNNVFEELKNEAPNRHIDLICKEDLYVYADPGLLKIVLTNLLSNSIKFTRDVDRARIEVGSTKKESQKIFYVKDNGVGFDSAYSDKLFKAFQRLHSQHEYDGTGIGLVTVKRIINSHRGKVWAESTPGKGAAFYFTLMQN